MGRKKKAKPEETAAPKPEETTEPAATETPESTEVVAPADAPQESSPAAEVEPTMDDGFPMEEVEKLLRDNVDLDRQITKLEFQKKALADSYKGKIDVLKEEKSNLLQRLEDLNHSQGPLVAMMTGETPPATDPETTPETTATDPAGTPADAPTETDEEPKEGDPQ